MPLAGQCYPGDRDEFIHWVQLFRGVAPREFFSPEPRLPSDMRYFEGKPEYAFGHGLTYTSFTYSRPSIGEAWLEAGEPQRLQNARFLPGVDSNSFMRSRPLSTCSADSATGMLAAKAS